MTDNQQWLSRKYLTYEFVSNMFFMNATWLYFYRLFVTDQAVGILDAAAFAIGLVAEVPSGALADRFGRARMVKIGQVLAGGGLLIQAMGSSFMPFFVGQAIMMIGVSFVSGADEALFFGKLNFDRASLEWRKLMTRGSQVGLVASLLATVAGGFLYTINPRIPWVLAGLALMSSVLIIWSIKDAKEERRIQRLGAEVAEHIASIKAGFSQFSAPNLLLYVPILLAVQGLFYTAGWGLLRLVLLDRFHFSTFWGSIAIATSGVLTVLLLALVHKYAAGMREKWVIATISLSAAVGLLASLADIGAWGYFVILVLYAGDRVLGPFMSEILNNRARESERATVLSVASFLRTLPYVVLAPIIGYLNTHGHLEYFLVAWGILICVAVAVYLAQKKKDVWVIFSHEDDSDRRVPNV